LPPISVLLFISTYVAIWKEKKTPWDMPGRIRTDERVPTTLENEQPHLLFLTPRNTAGPKLSLLWIFHEHLSTASTVVRFSAVRRYNEATIRVALHPSRIPH